MPHEPNFRALCAELYSLAHDLLDPEPRSSEAIVRHEEIFDRTRAALAAEPQGPTNEEWEEAKEKLWKRWRTKGYQGEEFMYDNDFDSSLDEARDFLARWGTPRPIPVTERLPKAEDRDNDNDCWWLTPSDEETGAFWCLYVGGIGDHTHWLPAHALPLPEVEG
jgi:hypothetical protein